MGALVVSCCNGRSAFFFPGRFFSFFWKRITKSILAISQRWEGREGAKRFGKVDR